jgi:hypothetical protein
MYPEDFDDLVIDSRVEFEALSEEVKVAWLVHRLEAEVNNGGFHQFFLNSSGAYVHETIAALSAIGADRTKVLLQRAVQACFPGGYPDNSEEHENFLADFDDIDGEVEPLDAAFFEYVDPLTDLTNSYLARTV